MPESQITFPLTFTMCFTAKTAFTCVIHLGGVILGLLLLLLCQSYCNYKDVKRILLLPVSKCWSAIDPFTVARACWVIGTRLWKNQKFL